MRVTRTDEPVAAPEPQSNGDQGRAVSFDNEALPAGVLEDDLLKQNAAEWSAEKCQRMAAIFRRWSKQLDARAGVLAAVN